MWSCSLASIPWQWATLCGKASHLFINHTHNSLYDCLRQRGTKFTGAGSGRRSSPRSPENGDHGQPPYYYTSSVARCAFPLLPLARFGTDYDNGNSAPGSLQTSSLHTLKRHAPGSCPTACTQRTSSAIIEKIAAKVSQENIEGEGTGDQL